jgi:hypothetical protein
MSYDLMVFDPALAPREREAFLAWHDREMEQTPTWDHNDPAVATPALQAWFFDMIREFPAMNGPHALDTESSKVTDYDFGVAYVYAAFGWSQVEAAYEAVTRLAAKHRLGFFDVSSAEAAVWLPDDRGQLVMAHANRPTAT